AHDLLPCDRRRRYGTRIADPSVVVTSALCALSVHPSPFRDDGKRPSWRNPSVIAIVAAIPTFKERSGGWIGIYTGTSAETRTGSGTPDDSRPTRIEPEATGGKGSLPDLPFLQLPVAEHNVNASFRSPPAQGKPHPDSHRQPLSQRATGRFDDGSHSLRCIHFEL